MIKFKVIDTDNSIEQLYVEITNLSQKLIVGVFYPAPKSDSDDYVKYTSTVEELTGRLVSHEFILCGDFNLPKTLWFNYNELYDCLNADCQSQDAKKM